MTNKTSYVTQAQLLDDGRARIDCPRKGVMAIARCREFQRETAAEGKSCRCSVFESYRGGEADSKMDPPPSEELCGREVTKDLDEEIAELQAKRRKGTGETQRRSGLPAAAISIDDEIANLQTRNHRPLRVIASDDNQEGATMPTHNKDAKYCDKCNKVSPAGTKLFGGLCKPCRDQVRDAERAKGKKKLEEILDKHVEKPRDVGGGGGGGGTVVVVESSAIPKDRQQLMQPMVQSDFDRLTRELKGLTRALNQVKWIAQGAREGYIPIERIVVEIEKAIEKAQG